VTASRETTTRPRGGKRFKKRGTGRTRSSSSRLACFCWLMVPSAPAVTFPSAKWPFDSTACSGKRFHRSTTAFPSHGSTGGSLGPSSASDRSSRGREFCCSWGDPSRKSREQPAARVADQSTRRSAIRAFRREPKRVERQRNFPPSFNSPSKGRKEGSHLFRRLIAIKITVTLSTEMLRLQIVDRRSSAPSGVW